jgi:hypothetical protein
MVPLTEKAAYWLERNVTQLIKALNIFEDARRALVKKHGTFDTETKTTTVPKENTAFWDEYKELLNQEVEVTINKIAISEISAKISAQEIAGIGFLLCEDKLIVPASRLIQ